MRFPKFFALLSLVSVLSFFVLISVTFSAVRVPALLLVLLTLNERCLLFASSLCMSTFRMYSLVFYGVGRDVFSYKVGAYIHRYVHIDNNLERKLSIILYSTKYSSLRLFNLI